MAKATPATPAKGKDNSKSKMAPMPKMKAKGAGTKTAPKPTPKQMKKKEAAPVAVTAPKKHERKSKPGETARIKDAKKLAAGYLVQRDEMDEDTAAAVVEGLGSEELAELIVEANTAVIERTKQGQGVTQGVADGAHSTEPPPALPGGVREQSLGMPLGVQGGQLVGDTDDEEVEGAIDYTTIPALAEVTVPSPWTRPNPDHPGVPGEHEELSFLDLTQYAARLSKAKNDAEKQYKAIKKLMIDLMDFAGTPNVAVGSVKLGRYTGHTLTLNENLLLEAGVPIEKIKKGWKDTPYEDVRITTPKASKGAA